MTALFEQKTETETTAPKERPDPKVVRLLEGYGYRAEAVRLWSPEQANTTLNSCKKEQAIALRRADDVARAQEESVPRGQPSWVERQEAAANIEQAQGEGIDELHQRVCYSLYALRDDELKRLAGHLIRLMRGEK
ncbi:MAG: hypothetical protein K8U57_31395 [Planctomycetes bacterium]|nr:hypothetical protein [Planctomycetota bacterium]